MQRAASPNGSPLPAGSSNFNVLAPLQAPAALWLLVGVSPVTQAYRCPTLSAYDPRVSSLLQLLCLRLVGVRFCAAAKSESTVATER